MSQPKHEVCAVPMTDRIQAPGGEVHIITVGGANVPASVTEHVREM